MRGGDISNEVPPRLYFTLESVTTPITTQKKVLGIVPVFEQSWEWNLRLVDKAWHVTNRYEVVAELIVFGNHSQEYVDSILAELDEMQSNPFNYGKCYREIDDLVNNLPYITSLRGVVDIPSRVARYGSWGIELENL
jgi:hypothetical protein